VPEGRSVLLPSDMGDRSVITVSVVSVVGLASVELRSVVTLYFPPARGLRETPTSISLSTSPPLPSKVGRADSAMSSFATAGLCPSMSEAGGANVRERRLYVSFITKERGGKTVFT